MAKILQYPFTDVDIHHPLANGNTNTKSAQKDIQKNIDVRIGEIVALLQKSQPKIKKSDIPNMPSEITMDEVLAGISTLRGKGEKATTEVIKDLQETFTLLVEKALSFANEKLKNGEKVSVGIYQEDTKHKDFVKKIEDATENGNLAKGLTLDIKSDPYGSIDNETSKRNIKSVNTLGVGFTIEPLIIKNDGTISVHRIMMIFKNLNIIPRFLKISEATLHAIQNSPNFITLRGFLNKMKESGSRILTYVGGVEAKENDNEQSVRKTMAENLIKSANQKFEPMFDINGNIIIEEILINFSQGISTEVGLKQLKELGHTQDLMKLMIGLIIGRAEKGQKTAINAYVKDLGSADLIKVISEITIGLDPKYRKNIIIEILEKRYGIIDDQFLNNIRGLQKAGYSIALDDLNVKKDNTSMSKEIFNELLGVGIYVDYLKLDGDHSMDIFNDTMTPQEIKDIKESIGALALLKNSPLTFVVEWVQDTHHAEKIRKIFDINGVDMLFQGRYLKNGEFGIQSDNFLL